MKSYTARGRTYLVTATEGDAREWGDYVEPARIKNLGEDGVPPLCEGVLTEEQLADEELGRLNVSTGSGLRADGSCFEKLYSFGGRSFSIWSTEGDLAFDSGDDFEQLVAREAPEFFNSDHTESVFDDRSDDKGPEPEGVTVGEIRGRTSAFVGLNGWVASRSTTSPTRAARPS